jgi:16S rRNA (adenine1518-N6/adenine1519-N6)-dimethyltransferase
MIRKQVSDTRERKGACGSAAEQPAKKKRFGQHFLRKQSVVDNMIDHVKIDTKTSILEIGCGDGFLTQSILQQTDCKRLICYDIDKEWVDFLDKKVSDDRLQLFNENILDVDFDNFKNHMPLVVLANLPYQITFPIFFLFCKNRNLFLDGVVMVQEEVAQKIVASRGKKYSATTIYLQHLFDFELLEKVEPAAFDPPPKVFSRLLYFKPRKNLVPIPEEERFWKFLKLCFLFPRQTLRNNLKTTHIDVNQISVELHGLRAQQLSFQDFLNIWMQIK